MAAYPKAKVILTTRDPDSWVRSMESCYYKILNMLQWWNPLIYYEPVRAFPLLRFPMILTVWQDTWGEFGKLTETLLMEWTSGKVQDRAALRRGFIMHNEHVRETAPKHNFLDFQPSDGWGPLCAFLGKEVPSGPFPRINEGSKAANGVRILIALQLVKMCVIPVAVLAMGWMAWNWA